MDRTFRRLISWIGLIALLGASLTAFTPPAVVLADHTPNPTSVVIPGSLQSELGCPGD